MIIIQKHSGRAQSTYKRLWKRNCCPENVFDTRAEAEQEIGCQWQWSCCKQSSEIIGCRRIWSCCSAEVLTSDEYHLPNDSDNGAPAAAKQSQKGQQQKQQQSFEGCQCRLRTETREILVSQDIEIELQPELDDEDEDDEHDNGNGNGNGKQPQQQQQWGQGRIKRRRSSILRKDNRYFRTNLKLHQYSGQLYGIFWAKGSDRNHIQLILFARTPTDMESSVVRIDMIYDPNTQQAIVRLQPKIWSEYADNPSAKDVAKHKQRIPVSLNEITDFCITYQQNYPMFDAVSNNSRHFIFDMCRQLSIPCPLLSTLK